MASSASSSRPPLARVPTPPLPPLLPLATPIQHSSDVWQDDLRSLFQQAKQRFGDVAWEVGQPGGGDEDDGPSEGPESNDTRPLRQGYPCQNGLQKGVEKVWGHKAIIYARAPPAFQARYFPPAQLRAPSPLGRSLSNGTSSTAYLASSANGSSLRVPSTVSLSSTLSAQSSATVRPPLQIHVDVTPQMFKAELEWLYTGEGMGEVVEWLSSAAGQRENGAGGAGLFGLGVGLEVPGAEQQQVGLSKGFDDQKRERLRNDLVYMWRSKLFSDVKLVLPLDSSAPRLSGSSVYGPDHSPNDSSLHDESTATTATFTTHKFILASRSPYFAQLLLNPGGFRSVDPERGEIKLSSPPFTPASIHFCLGYMYAGTLAFSNRKHDLQTAFQIHRSASYLQMASLRSEIESRIIHEMCDSLSLERTPPPSKLTSRRVPRVWRFAAAPDVGAKELEARCREWVVCHWGECWGPEVGAIGKRERDALVKDTLALLRPELVVGYFRALLAVRARTEAEVRTVQRGVRQSAWSENLLGMLLEIEQKLRSFFARYAEKVFDSDDFGGLLEGRGFERELLVKMLEDLAVGVSGPESCKVAPRVYQALVNSLLLKVSASTSEPTLSSGSDIRNLVESTRTEIIKHIRRRWLQIREKGGFQGLEGWALKEIADDIDQPIDELLAPPTFDLKPPLRKPPVLSSSITRPPRTPAHLTGGRDSDAVSVAGRSTLASRTSTLSRTAALTTSRPQPKLPTAGSVRSTPARIPAPRPSVGASKDVDARSVANRASVASRAATAARASVPGSVPTVSPGATSSASRTGSSATPRPAPSRPAATSSRSSLASSTTSSRPSLPASSAVSVKTTPVSSPDPPAASSARRRTVSSTSATPFARKQPAASTIPSRSPSAASVRSTASTLRRQTMSSPATPVPKLSPLTKDRVSSPAGAKPRSSTTRPVSQAPSLTQDVKRPDALPSKDSSHPPLTSPSPEAPSPAPSSPDLPLRKSRSSETSERSFQSSFVLSSVPSSIMRPARYDPAAAFDPPRRVPIRHAPSREPFVIHDVETKQAVEPEHGVSLNIGIPVLFHPQGHAKPFFFSRAFVRYLGRLRGEKGPWVGLEIAEADVKTIFEIHQNGVYRGIKYFEVGDEDEDWNDSGLRRRKTSSTSISSARHRSEHSLQQSSLSADRPCVFVRPIDVAWVKR